MNGRPLYGHFIGTGWAFPPAFTAGGADVAMAQDEQDIVESLQILLATSLGERVMREDYGCNLRDYLFEELDQRLLSNLRLAVADSIRQHETRVETEDIRFDVQADFQQSVIYIRIGFRVRATNSRYNMVYPFYLTESTLGPAGETTVLPSTKIASVPLPMPTQITTPPDEIPPLDYEPFISFRHQANEQNTDKWAGNYTRLDHPRLNGNPDAIIFVNAIWAFDPALPSKGTSNPNSLEVDYRNGYWYICNRDPKINITNGDTDGIGHAFNVLIAPPGIPNAFVSVADAVNTQHKLSRMYIDNQHCNGKPDALIMATPRGGVISNREIGVSYEAGGIQKWFVYHQLDISDPNAVYLDENQFPIGAAVNVLVLDEKRLGNLLGFKHQYTAETKAVSGTFLTHEALDGKAEAMAFVTQAWPPGVNGAHNPIPIGLWFDSPHDGDNWKENHWIIYNMGKPKLEYGPAFMVFVIDQ